jgi:hypothetical protein
MVEMKSSKMVALYSCRQEEGRCRVQEKRKMLLQRMQKKKMLLPLLMMQRTVLLKQEDVIEEAEDVTVRCAFFKSDEH